MQQEQRDVMLTNDSDGTRVRYLPIPHPIPIPRLDSELKQRLRNDLPYPLGETFYKYYEMGDRAAETKQLSEHARHKYTGFTDEDYASLIKLYRNKLKVRLSEYIEFNSTALANIVEAFEQGQDLGKWTEFVIEQFNAIMEHFDLIQSVF